MSEPTDRSPSSTDEVPPRPRASSRGDGDLTGNVLGKRYRIEQVVGVGGMGSVYAATDLNTTARVAVKVLKSDAVAHQETVERFFREARAAVAIDSAHVVKVLDVGETGRGGAPYMVMEFLEGEDLGAIIQRRGQLPVGESVDYIVQACIGLAKAHAIGIVHRDIKPSNLWVAPGSGGATVLKVLDFGISKADASSGVEKRLTATTSVFGSPSYMSPEQVRSAKNVDHRTDIWGLGVALYEALSGGRLPFEGDNAGAVFAAIIADPPRPIATFRKDVPERLEGIVFDALSKPREGRIASAAELARRLSPFASLRVVAMLEAGLGIRRHPSLISTTDLSPPSASHPGPVDSSRNFLPARESAATAPVLLPVPQAPMATEVSFGQKNAGLAYVIGGVAAGLTVGAVLLYGLWRALSAHDAPDATTSTLAGTAAVDASPAIPAAAPSQAPAVPVPAFVPPEPVPSVSAEPTPSPVKVVRPVKKPPVVPTAKTTAAPVNRPVRLTPAQAYNQLYAPKK